MAEHQTDHAFFEKVQADNELLRQLLGQVKRVFTGDQKHPSQVTGSLATLASQLETHFEEEEIAGVFDDVVERAPHMTERVDRLKQEHNELRAAFAAIHQKANSGDGTAEWWNGLSKAFHDFSTDLMHHETKENELVQEAYTQDIGAKD